MTVVILHWFCDPVVWFQLNTEETRERQTFDLVLYLFVMSPFFKI